MCGIYGSTDRDRYLTLQKLNTSRGDFCESNLLLNNEGFEIHKIPKRAKKEYKFPKRKKFNLYLGHSQAPTSAKRLFDPETSHPFAVENWIVAHNGVLTNYKELINEFQRPYDNPVDSSVIPYILYKLSEYSDDEVEIIVNSLEFSSVKHKFFDPIEEGTLYQLTHEGTTVVGTFDCDSPFFTV